MKIEISTYSRDFAILVAIRCEMVAARSINGEFSLQSVANGLAGVKLCQANLYGPGGISETLQLMGIIEHSPYKGRFVMAKDSNPRDLLYSWQ